MPEQQLGQRPSPEPWEWVAAGMILLLSTGALLPLLQAGGSRVPGAGGNPTTIVIWSAFYVLAFVQIGREGVRRIKTLRMDYGLVGLLVVAMLSTMWSLDPALTFRRSLALGGTAIIGAWLGLRFSTKRLLILLAVALGAVGAINLAYGLAGEGLDPNHLADRAWRGAFESKNLMAQVTVLSLIVFFIGAAAEKGKRAIPYWLGLVVCVGLVLMTASATGLIMTVSLISILAFFYLLRVDALKAVRALLVSIVAVLLGVVMVSSGLLSIDAPSVFAIVGRTETLTGRTEIWGYVAQSIAERPVLGFGHGAFWTGVTGEGSGTVARMFGQDAGYAHNGFLDVVLAEGFLGLGLYLLSFVESVGLAVRRLAQRPSARGTWPVLFLVFLVMANLTEGGLVQQNHYMLLLYVAVAVRLRR